MTELFDTRRIRDDEAHWDALAERVAAHAARRSKANGFERLGHARASWVATSLLIAAALAVWAATADDSTARDFGATWERALSPTDDVGKALVLNPLPPSIGGLLLGESGAR